MSKNSMISVIIPVYNGEKTIKRCINSIINQTYSNLDIIIVNDGSSDNTQFICEEISNNYSFVKVINKENAGVSEARNTGIEFSKGEYIIFVDSDDIIEADMCETLLKNNKKSIMPICGINLVNEAGNIIESLDFNKNGIMDGYLDKNQYLKLFKMDLLNSPCNKLFSAKLIKTYDIRFDKKLSIGEDLIFVMDYLKYIDGFSIINRGLYNYVKSETDSLSVKVYKDMYEIQKELFNKLINPVLNDNIENIDLYNLKETYYIIVWRSVRNLLRNSKDMKMNFRLNEMKKILFDNITINNIKLYNIGSILWYIKNKLKKI